MAASSAVPEPAPTPKVPSIPGVERVTVRLAQFDVVVRDSTGKVVTGLTASDFKVTEDGAPLEVVAVDEWGDSKRGVPTPADQVQQEPNRATPPATGTLPDAAGGPERRSFVLVFDALGDSTALRMNQAKRAAVEFVRSRFHADDVGAVYQLDLSLRSVSPITSDPEVLARGIDKVAWMPASSLADQINESVLAYTNAANQSVAQERLTQQSASVAGQLDWEREHTYSSLNDLASIFQSLPGKRVLILISPGFPMTTNLDQRFQSGGFTPKFQKLIKSMATYGITVYSLDIGSELTAGDAGQAIDWRVAVGKLGMDENVLSDLGLDRTLGTNSATSRRQFLGVIAAETGGRMLTDTNLNRAFTAVDEETSHFYRLSCRVALSTDLNRYRSFRVSVSRPGYSVTTRRGRYSDVTPLESVPVRSSTATQIDSLAGYKRLTSQGVAVSLPAGAAAKIPVAVVIEVQGPVEIAVSPEGVAKLDLDILIVARAADEIVGRYQHGFTATLKHGVEAVRSGFRVEGRLDLPPGIYELQGTVRLASPAQLATWSATAAVSPQPKAPTPGILGPIVAIDAAAAPLLSQPATVESADPLTVKAGFRMLPAPGSEFPLGPPLLILFWLDNFAPPGEKLPAIDFSAGLTEANGTAVKGTSQLLYFGRSAAGGLSAVVRLDSANLAAGTYLVEIKATPPSRTSPLVRHSAPFSLRAREADAPTPEATSSSKP